jgi:hypothetical protein
MEELWHGNLFLLSFFFIYFILNNYFEFEFFLAQYVCIYIYIYIRYD